MNNLAFFQKIQFVRLQSDYTSALCDSSEKSSWFVIIFNGQLSQKPDFSIGVPAMIDVVAVEDALFWC